LENLENYFNSISVAPGATTPEVAKSFVSRLVKGNIAVQKNLVHMHEYPTAKFVLPTIEVTAALTDYESTPSASQGSINLGKREMSNKRSMHYKTFEPEDLLAYYADFAPQGLLNEQELPAEVLDKVFELTMNRLGSQIGKLIWNGDTSITTGDTSMARFDGLIKQAKADAGVKKVAGAAAITKANVVDALQSVLDLSDEVAKEEANFKLIVNKAVAEAYGQYQKNQASKGVDITQRGLLTYDGYTMVVDSHLPADTILATYTSAAEDSNLWVGTNLVKDLESLRYGRVSAASNDWFVRLDIRMGTGIIKPEDLVIYTL
jgi:hypothetical protein